MTNTVDISVADQLDGLDAFQADLQAHQLKQGVLPTPDDNKALSVDLMNTLNNKGQLVNEHVAKAVEPDLDRLVYSIKKSDDTDEHVQDVTPIAQRAYKRFSFLLTQLESGPLGQPSWASRARAVQDLFVLNRGPTYAEQMKRYSFELIKLITESDRYFGNWKLDFS